MTYPKATQPVWPFFVGRGRSGTTLLRAMFDSHSQMAVPPESHFIATMPPYPYQTKKSFDSARFAIDLLRRPPIKG
ncbi:MAG: sulfotransferase, partial [Acidimicrobiia bacterium]